jgi:hypothetical protein
MFGTSKAKVALEEFCSDDMLIREDGGIWVKLKRPLEGMLTSRNSL